MTHARLTTSVIICTRNRLTDLLTCLASLRAQTAQPTELIIIDSSDTPLTNHASFTAAFHAAQFLHTQLIYDHTTPGLTYQRNCGIARASGDVLYFFDDDVALEPDYLAQMNSAFAQHPEYGGGMGSITNMDPYKRSLSRLLHIIFLLPRDYASGLFTWSGMPTHAYGTQQFKRVEVLGGCCMAYRSWALAAHRFDEQLTRYGYMEDADIARRISRTHPLFFNPLARLQHHNSPLARDAIADNRAMFVQNYSYLFFKNIYPRNRLKIIAYAWSITGLFLEALLTRNGLYSAGYRQGLRRAWHAHRAQPQKHF
jgi:GT2 family glycosyltransferase